MYALIMGLALLGFYGAGGWLLFGYHITAPGDPTPSQVHALGIVLLVIGLLLTYAVWRRIRGDN